MSWFWYLVLLGYLQGFYIDIDLGYSNDMNNDCFQECYIYRAIEL